MKPHLTRDLVSRLPCSIPDPGPMERVQVADDHYPRLAEKMFAQHRAQGASWVFAIGSLIWKPRPYFGERQPALVRGWHRAFCLGPDERYRGNPAAPGLMLSLDRGGSCRGVVFRLKDDIREEDFLALVQSEPPPPARLVKAHTPEGVVPAWAFVCPRDYPGYVSGLSDDQIADHLSRCVGMLGSMAEYLLNTVEHLSEEGIHDAMLWRMQKLVAERLERL